MFCHDSLDYPQKNNGAHGLMQKEGRSTWLGEL